MRTNICTAFIHFTAVFLFLFYLLFLFLIPVCIGILYMYVDP